MKFAFSLTLLLFASNLYAECLLRGVQYLETRSDRADIAVADFNNDGYSDVAIAGSEARIVRIYLNDGDGNFQINHERYFKNHPLFIKSGDFNGDAISDLAVATAGSVTVLSGLGTGKFTIGPRINVSSIAAIAVADFNSDSIGDLAVLTKNDQSGSVVVFLKRGQSFQKTQTMPVQSPSDMVAAALGSGRSTDLIIASSRGTLSIFKGSATGLFTESRTVQAVPGASRLATGFIDRDSKIDLVAAGANGVVGVFYGINENEFRKVQISTVSEVLGMVPADFNNDGDTDLLFVNRNFRAVLYEGKSHGRFLLKRNFSFSLFSGSIVAADFNGDKNADFIATESGAAGIFLGTGNHNFIVGAKSIINKGGNLFSGDFDGDNFADLLISNSDESLYIRGKGNGSFYPPIRTNLPQVGQATVVDMNEDGKDDLAGFDRFVLKVWLSETRGQFIEATFLPLPTDPQVHALDLNQDGLKDLAVFVPRQLVMFLQQPTGEFARARPFSIPFEDRATLGDLNRDAFADLVTVGEGRSNRMRVYLGGPDLTFIQYTEIPLGNCPGGVSIGEANGDGFSDVAVGSSCDADIGLFFGDGVGGLSAEKKIRSGSSSFEPVFADFNGDGKEEILAIARDSAKPFVTVAPEFQNYFLFGPFYWNRIATEDFNNDGHLDLAASSFNSTALFLNCE